MPGGSPRPGSHDLAHLRGPHDDAVAVHSTPPLLPFSLPPQAHCHRAQRLVQAEEWAAHAGSRRQMTSLASAVPPLLNHTHHQVPLPGPHHTSSDHPLLSPAHVASPSQT